MAQIIGCTRVLSTRLCTDGCAAANTWCVCPGSRINLPLPSSPTATQQSGLAIMGWTGMRPCTQLGITHMTYEWCHSSGVPTWLFHAT